MLYTIRQVENQPIYIVRVLPPLHTEKQIYAIDAELLRLTAHENRRICRIDDFTNLHPHQFTRSDAAAWFAGAVREDLHWRTNMAHVAICKPRMRRLVASLVAEGKTIHVPTVPTLQAALAYAAVEINRQREEWD